jgi:phosphonate transport system substrate-binding protein
MMTNAARRRFCLGAALALASPGLVRAAPGATLRLGLMPVYGIRSLMSRYEPMRSYIARLLGQPVRVETAPDFQRYLKSILTGEFDIAVAAAHFARIAQLDAGWAPLAQFEPDHDTLLIVRSGEIPAKPSALAGGEVAVIDRLAITVMGALHYLERQGLVADKDYKVVEYRNHASVVHSLISGVSRMAVTTSHGLRQIPADLLSRVTVYRSVFDIPAFVIIGSPTLPKPALDKLRTGMLAFPREAEGLDFLGQNSYTGLHATDETAMKRADPFLKETRRMVGQ